LTISEPLTRGEVKMPRGGRREPPGGREPRVKGQPSTKRHMVRFTLTEYEYLQQKADKLGITLSEYLRRCALEKDFGAE
jgi:hypothetical protein